MRAACLLLFIAGCAAPTSRTAGADLGGDRPDLEDVGRLVHREANRARHDLEVAVLRWSDRLARAARSHSLDMANHDYFAHESRDGRSPSDRAEEAGVECRVEMGRERYRTGVLENLFVTTAYESVREQQLGSRTERSVDWFTPREIASETVRSWLDSPGHRRNLLDGTASRQGVGVAVRDDRIFITQVLC